MQYRIPAPSRISPSGFGVIEFRQRTGVEEVAGYLTFVPLCPEVGVQGAWNPRQCQSASFQGDAVVRESLKACSRLKLQVVLRFHRPQNATLIDSLQLPYHDSIFAHLAQQWPLAP